MRLPRRTAPLFLAAALATGALAGCSSDGSDASSTTATPSTTTAASSTTAAPDATTTTTPPSTAAPTTTAAAASGPCTSGATTVPAGAVSKPIIDVDGDGTADTGWIQDDGGTVTVGIVTAAGGGATAGFDSASPVSRSMLVADADEDGRAEIFLDDGRLVQLDAFQDCSIVAVENPQGEPYTFGLGFTDVGTGVGCIDADGGRRLAGLDVTEDTGDGGTVAWSSTVVDLDGTTATNGAKRTGTYTRPADDAKIELLSQVTCGDLTMAADGISAPQ